MSAVSDLFDQPDRAECGTLSGHSRHKRDGETVCPACFDAKSDYNADKADRAPVKAAPKRESIVHAMRSMDEHRAARAALREQMRGDL